MSAVDIDYALVEKTRPPIYTAMKYWGKKPHNIWREYIKNYTPSNGIYLDPFAGSAMSAFEAVKAGRKVIAFDLNPLTSFIIEVCCSSFDKTIFVNAVYKIIHNIKEDRVYQKYYTTTCRKCDNDLAILQHSKWEENSVYEIGVICDKCIPGKSIRYITKANKNDLTKSLEIDKIPIDTWFPKDKFYNSPSFSKSFVEKIKGTSYSDIWTKRNLYVLSKIFDLILKQRNKDLKMQLLFGFLQSIHLCSKMCVPRREGANRAFSTSWGRSTYICSNRQMEMNPLLLFENNCVGKQSVQSSLDNVKGYLGKIPKIKCASKINKNDRKENYDIKYGIIDVNTIRDYVEDSSIDFILTDPPYGGLVQYLDLSNVWLVWLKRYDKKFTPNIESEITVKKGVQNIEVYNRRFANSLKNLYKVLKPSGKIVFTFHNKDLEIWNIFLRSISEAGFQIEKVIHQQNRRTGESNVSNPYGTSASDFYIRCKKTKYVNIIKTTKDEFENFAVDRAVKIISARNEPTPYQILFNGLLSEISKAGFEIKGFDCNIKNLLSNHIGSVFTVTENNNDNSGNYWWLLDYEVIKKETEPLSDRVENTVKNLFRSKVALTFDEVLAEIFIKYPNGLTPDTKSIHHYIKKYATKSGGKWLYKGK